MVLAGKLPQSMVGGNGNCVYGRLFDGEKGGKQALGCAAEAYGMGKCPIGALQSRFGMPLCGKCDECTEKK